MTLAKSLSHDSTMLVLSPLLLERGLRIATAESCTAGLIGATLTDPAGSSAWFDGGFLTYSNEAKQSMLGVSSADLAQHGAVSEPVVKQMACGALSNSRADIAVAVSGVAGPDGGSAEKPVGTVWLGWACTEPVAAQTSTVEPFEASDISPVCWALRMQFEGPRSAVRGLAVESALRGIIQIASGHSPSVDAFPVSVERIE